MDLLEVYRERCKVLGLPSVEGDNGERVEAEESVESMVCAIPEKFAGQELKSVVIDETGETIKDTWDALKNYVGPKWRGG